ncbi:MAG: archease [Candidatus Micrarchaeia archaeon]
MRSKIKYRYVEHTADVKFIAYGKDIRELFSNSAIALFNVMADTSCVSNSSSRSRIAKVSVHAEDEKALLWRFLQRCLSVLEVRGDFAYSVQDLHIVKGKVLKLQCRLGCKGMEVECSSLEAKGISKYDLAIRRGKAGYSASVVVDV